ncbi:MAG: ABC transporter substrate-binding protein [Desulfovibrionales bacterium]|mgnify:CR=1 FL=1|nr:ABC transporter substrate-binding protein [Desulfovibrionales bacterium]
MKRLVLFFVLFPALALAMTSPTDYVRTNVDAVVAILTDPQLQGEEKKSEQMLRIESVVDGIFDSQELSKRALAQHWKLFREDQRQEFQKLFLELIKHAYLKKSIAYNNEVVQYNQELVKSETLAEVHTVLTSPTVNMPIIYYMIRRDDSWKVYDVSVENVSLVKNYRSQFQSILQNSSPDQLIAILREKIHE